MREPPPTRGRPRFSSVRTKKVDTVAARRSLVNTAREVARHEDDTLAAEGLHLGTSDDRVASYRGVGIGLYFKVLHWIFWMMMWMMLCSVPYLITINTSVFTDYAHKNDHKFGVKMFEGIELSSFTFAAIVDDKTDNGTLAYMNTNIADTWRGPMQKGVFLTWISLVDAGATILLTAGVALLFYMANRWLRRVDSRTREVSDYSVIIGGLPPTITATEVGEYFERHFSKDRKVDKVMDVVLVRGFSTVVDACKEVHKYEQLKRFVANLETRGSVHHDGHQDQPTQPPHPASPATRTNIAAAATAAYAAGAIAGAAVAGVVGSNPTPISDNGTATGGSSYVGSVSADARSDVVSHGTTSEDGSQSHTQSHGHSGGGSSNASGVIGKDDVNGSSCSGGAASNHEGEEDARGRNASVPIISMPSGAAAAMSPRGMTPRASRAPSGTATPVKSSPSSVAAAAPSTPRRAAATVAAAAPAVPGASTPPSRAASLATPSRVPTGAVGTPTKAKPATFNLSAVAATVGGSAAAAAASAAAEANATAEKTKDPEAGSVLPLAETLSLDMSREMLKVESKIAEHRESVERCVREGKLTANAALVTFNTESMRMEVCDTLPGGWWGAWFMPKVLRLEHGGRKWRVWVRKAAAPDDFRFENLSVRIRTNMFIQVITAIVMFFLIVVCAAFITWLSALSSRQDRTPLWDHPEMLAAVRIGMAKLTPSASMQAVSQSTYDAFCSGAMPSCSLYANDHFPAANMNLTFRAEWQFSNATARLLNERPLHKDLQQCAESVSCPASFCLPCYCMGLSQIPTDDVSPEFLSHMQETCASYWAPFDLQRNGIRVAISFVVAIINALLTFVLRALKYNVEKHWTTTDTELSFAVWAYVVKLFNSVAILLVVNCSTLRNMQKDALAEKASWVQNFILNGLYDDFTPSWYTAVGFSIQILMMINVIGPVLRSLTDWAAHAAAKVKLLCLHCGQLAAPEEYNAAFRSQQFTLENRIADVLFNVTLALLFGSGMPLCYLIAAVYVLVTFWWDRLQLLTWNQPAQRYQKHLPRFIMVMLPVLLAAHCAFGLWMHTYFKAEMKNMDLVAAASSGLSQLDINTLAKNSVGGRITQPNGLALLIWFVILAVWLVFGRWITWAAFKCLSVSCAKLSSFVRPSSSSGGAPGEDGTSGVTYEEALSSVKIARMLRGARTYRVHHLTNYKPFLTSGEAGRLWATAQGEQRFTRLTTFRVYVEVEVAEGRRKHTEQRMVEMFDVSEGPITSGVPNVSNGPVLPYRPAKGAAAGEAGSATLSLTPFSAMNAAAAAAAADGADAHGSVAAGAGPLASAHLSLTPSAALQSAALQQVATLEANTGVVVKRVSLRAVPHPTAASYDPDAAARVPAFELDLNSAPAMAATLSAYAATAGYAAAAAADASACVRSGAELGRSTAGAPPATTPSPSASPYKSLIPSAMSVPVFKLMLDRSPSAFSGHHTLASFRSVPASGSPPSAPKAATARKAIPLPRQADFIGPGVALDYGQGLIVDDEHGESASESFGSLDGLDASDHRGSTGSKTVSTPRAPSDPQQLPQTATAAAAPPSSPSGPMTGAPAAADAAAPPSTGTGGSAADRKPPLTPLSGCNSRYRIMPSGTNATAADSAVSGSAPASPPLPASGASGGLPAKVSPRLVKGGRSFTSEASGASLSSLASNSRSSIGRGGRPGASSSTAADLTAAARSGSVGSVGSGKGSPVHRIPVSRTGKAP